MRQRARPGTGSFSISKNPYGPVCLCPPNRQMACLSSSYTTRERNFLLLTSTPGD